MIKRWLAREEIVREVLLATPRFPQFANLSRSDVQLMHWSNVFLLLFTHRLFLSYFNYIFNYISFINNIWHNITNYKISDFEFYQSIDQLKSKQIHSVLFCAHSIYALYYSNTYVIVKHKLIHLFKANS